MSDTKDTATEYPIPGGDINAFAHVQLSASLDRIASCASVKVDGDEIRLYLGDLSVTLPADTWRPIVDALTEALEHVTDESWGLVPVDTSRITGAGK